MVSTGAELSGAWNFRDVAEETGIRPGRFFRSSQLSRLDDAGRSTVARLGIDEVADLRSLREVQRQGPGRVPDGVAVHQLPFFELTADAAGAPHESAFVKMMTGRRDGEDIADSAARFMVEEYERFPDLPGAKTAVRQVITMLADERSVIAHCFAGKDRTGFTVALVLDTVGVPREAIIADYLRSNAAVPQLRERILNADRNRASGSVETDFGTLDESHVNDEVLGVREEYLDAAKRAIDTTYGSPAAYLEAVGVTTDQVSRLRTALLT